MKCEDSGPRLGELNFVLFPQATGPEAGRKHVSIGGEDLWGNGWACAHSGDLWCACATTSPYSTYNPNVSPCLGWETCGNPQMTHFGLVASPPITFSDHGKVENPRVEGIGVEGKVSRIGSDALTDKIKPGITYVEFELCYLAHYRGERSDQIKVSLVPGHDLAGKCDVRNGLQ